MDFGRFRLAMAGARAAEKRGDPGTAAQKSREALECWTGLPSWEHAARTWSGNGRSSSGFASPRGKNG
ncbi:hypothetical protein GCM10017567_19670 [Amycolatopsis bullii]|uniref:Bacterial transcriptional activator domain-containing protein n=1 Tax=Amycolatopsis bullii TaxID=941987 RepID=A0ABQ3K6B6_9PSEU|nr:hypothetical protein GCM10017567_19670 [Amycolatopsis bullii]